LNTDSDEADVTSLGRPFHTFAIIKIILKIIRRRSKVHSSLIFVLFCIA